jgi:hypothetical protein
MKFGSITTGIITDGLVFNIDPANRACYPKTGTTATDTVTNNVGTLNGTTFISTTGSGIFDFDGADDYIQTTFNPYTSIGDNTSWTVSSWVYVSNVTTQQRILGVYDTTRASRFWIGIVNGGILFGYGNKGAYPISGTSVSANSWQNIIVTYSTTTGIISAYANGSINGTYDYAGNSGNGTIANANITIGDSIGDSNLLNGNIGPIQIYNRALSASEVLFNYNGLKSRFGL